MNVTVTVYRQLQAFRQRIDDRNADAMQTAGYLVRVIVEFSAGVEDGQDDFRGGAPLFRVLIDRDAAAVVGDADGLVGMDRDGNF